MVPLKQLKPKSAGMKIKQNKVDICPADPQNSYFKRDVPNIILNLKEKLKKEKPVEPHIHSVLINSKIGKMSSVGLQLNYKFTLCTAEALADHDYCTNKLFDRDTINISPEKFPLHIKINSQLNANAGIIKIDLSFVEAPQPSGDNYVYVQQNSPEWLDIRPNKLTGSRLPALLGFYGKTQFEMT